MVNSGEIRESITRLCQPRSRHLAQIGQISDCALFPVRLARLWGTAWCLRGGAFYVKFLHSERARKALAPLRRSFRLAPLRESSARRRKSRSQREATQRRC